MNGKEKYTIQSVKGTSSKLKPIIVEFQNGILRPSAAKDLDCGVYEDKQTKMHSVAVSTPSMSYFGKESIQKNCQTFLAIRKRNSSDINLVATKQVLLSPLSRGYKDKSPKNTLTFGERYAELGKKFGAKRFAAKFENKLQTSVDAVEQQLETSASQVVKTENNTPGLLDFYASLPPCNRFADRAKNVYKMEDIVSDIYLEDLKPEGKRMLETGEEEFDNSKYKYSDLYKMLFRHIRDLQVSEEEKIKQMAILTYAEYIISLIKFSQMRIVDPNFVVCQMSEKVNEKLLIEFTQETMSGRSRTLELKDKAICHVIIIALLLHRFKVPFNQMASSFKCTIKQLNLYCEAVGATKVTDEGTSYASLQLPLVMPTLRNELNPKKRFSKRK